MKETTVWSENVIVEEFKINAGRRKLRGKVTGRREKTATAIRGSLGSWFRGEFSIQRLRDIWKEWKKPAKFTWVQLPLNPTILCFWKWRTMKRSLKFPLFNATGTQ
jgi:hypothetical protein